MNLEIVVKILVVAIVMGVSSIARVWDKKSWLICHMLEEFFEIFYHRASV